MPPFLTLPGKRDWGIATRRQSLLQAHGITWVISLSVSRYGEQNNPGHNAAIATGFAFAGDPNRVFRVYINNFL